MNVLADNTNVYLVKFDEERKATKNFNKDADSYDQIIDKFIMSVSWSKGGTVQVYYNWREHSDGKAGGYGYDKESAAVDSFFKIVFAIDLNSNAVGMTALIANAEKQGIHIYSLGDALGKL